MDPFEPRIHSFIVKIWLEESDEELDATVMHGHVTHVPGGERHYIRSEKEIPLLITSCLQRMGVRLQSN